MRVYWDQAFLARPLPDGEMAAKIQINEVALSGAHFHRRGFPREHSPDGREPRLYDYGILDNTQPFRSMPGDYTRFGRVTELLTRADDRFVVFGKGAGGGYAAIGGILLAERVASALDLSPGGPFTHAQTYGGHAVACAVGRRVLSALREEKIEERVRSMEGALRAALEPLAAHPNVLEVRGVGFLWGLVLRADRGTGAPFPRGLRVAERIEALCRDRGLLIFAGSGSADGESGDHLLLAPPLVSDTHHFAQIAILLRQALEEAIRDTRSPGLSPR